MIKRKIIALATIFIFITSVLYAQELKGFLYASNQMEPSNTANEKREYIIGETAYCAILAKGFSINPDNSVDLSADIKFVDPSDKLLLEQSDYAGLKKIVQKNTEIVNLDKSFDISFTKEDPLGMYTVEICIKDKISNTSNRSQSTLLLFDTEESKNLIMAPVKTAKQLDDLWAEYFRSKNIWAVKRIISALRLRKESDNIDDAAVGSAAAWSLEINAKEYPEVLKICKQSLEQTKGSTKELLAEIIEKVEKKNF